MKKYILMGVFSCIALFGSIPESKSSGFNYETTYSFSLSGGTLYFVSTCTETNGSGCDTPGASSRTDVGWILKILI